MSTLEIIQTVINIALVGALILCARKLRYCAGKLSDYKRDVQIMTCRSDKLPTDPELIEEWAQKRAGLKHGSPKWIAYDNALKAEGYDGD